MFGIAGQTQFDVRFRVFGIPVRVHPLFWLLSAYLCWSPRNPKFVLVGIACIFVSILVHELGHAVTIRIYGYPSEIVLHAMGGYATGGRFSTWRNVLVSAAGPAAGFSLGLIALVLLQFNSQQLIQYPLLAGALGYLWIINSFWTAINLVPCLPLDGGRIMEALVHRYAPRRAPRTVMLVSIIASGATAVAAFKYMPGARMLPLFFGFICIQTIMVYNNRRSY